MDKNFSDYIYTKLPLILYHNSYFAQKQKKSGSQRNKHDFEVSMPSCRMCCTNGPLHRSTNYKIMFLFTDPQRFYPFVHNHCYSIKLKPILYRYLQFSIHRFCLSIFVGNRVKKDLLIINSKIGRCPL